MRKSQLFWAMAGLGKAAISTLISSTIVQSRQAWRKPSTSKLPSSRRNLTEVDRREVARRVVEEHVFGARVRGVDAPVLRAGVPLVDGRVVLQRPDRRRPRRRRRSRPTAFRAGRRLDTLPSVRRVSAHSPSLRQHVEEVVGHADAVVAVLAGDGEVGLAVPVRVVLGEVQLGRALAAPAARSSGCTRSGIIAARASRSAARRAALVRGLTSVCGPWPFAPGTWQALTTACSRRLARREPATSAATFCSSTTFQRMNSITSGWSRSRQTILAARRVVPPDLMAPAARSPIFRKDISPDDLPPPDSGSFSPRSAEKFEPVPDPYLKMRASRVHRSMMPPSLTRSSRDGLDEARVGLRALVGRGGAGHGAGVGVDVVVALGRAGEAVGLVETRVEPLRRVGGGDLGRQHVAQLVVEGLGVSRAVEVAVALAPVPPAAGEAIEDLPGVPLAAENRAPLPVLGRLAVGADLGHPGLPEVLLGQDVRRHGRPALGDGDPLLTEDGRSVRVLDLRGADVELHVGVGALTFAGESPGDLHAAYLLTASVTGAVAGPGTGLVSQAGQTSATSAG